MFCSSAGIFPHAFLQLVNGSKNSILNWVMKLSLFMCFFFFFFETPLKGFPFYSPIILALWFRYLQTHIKEVCMYLSSQLFLKTPHETLKSQEKSKLHFSMICRPKFQKNFPSLLNMGQPHGAIELRKQWRNWIFGEIRCRKLLT